MQGRRAATRCVRLYVAIENILASAAGDAAALTDLLSRSRVLGVSLLRRPVRPLVDNLLLLKLLLEAFVSRLVASNDERDGRLWGLVGMASIEWWRWIILNCKLNCLRDLRSREFGDDPEREVDSRSDPARGKKILVAHNSSFFVRGANQRQEVHIGPVRRRPTPLQQSCCAEKKGAGANGGHILGARALAANEVNGLVVGNRPHDACAAGYGNEVESRTGLEVKVGRNSRLRSLKTGCIALARMCVRA